MKILDLKNKKFPDSPGVYFFKKKKEVLYIGKATSLKDRIKSYFGPDLIQTRGPLIVDMVWQADNLDFIKTPSVLEALILEANLIKKYQPKYNTKEKSNKSFNYVVITKEAWPRVLIVREREIEKGLGYDLKDKFGPFTQGESLRRSLKIIRKIFPFRDRCLPYNSQADNSLAIAKLLSTTVRKPCFNRQLGLCPGVCDGTISQKEYGKIIKKIKLLFSGKIKNLKDGLKKEMFLLAKKHEYEKANEIKKQIFALEHIEDVAIIASEATIFSPPQLRRGDYSDNRGGCFRIEAYDVAHLSGTNNVGVMVVMENGPASPSEAGWEFKKSDYRKFKIRNSQGNDVGALKEVLERRFGHPEWPVPNLIVVDGGLAQLNVAQKVLLDQGLTLVQIVAVTKDNKHKPKAIIGEEGVVKKYKKEILLANNEAHRFALAFHRRKRIII